MLRPSLLPFLVLLNDLPEVDGNRGLCPRTRLKIRQYCRLRLKENGIADNLISFHFLSFERCFHL